MKKKISAIIHFLNSEMYLEEAIKSVLWQTFSDWELILVDGGSTDQSREIAKSYSLRFPDRIQSIRHDGPGSLGIFLSRVAGAKAATAPILAHLDSDDEWHPRFLERQSDLYQAYFSSRAGMVYCPMIYWWEEPQLANQIYVQPVPEGGLHEPPHLTASLFLDSYSRSPGNSSVMIDRGILLESSTIHSSIQEQITEDQFLWSFVTLRYPVFVNPEPLVRYRQWTGSVCARTIAAGKHYEARRTHLLWLSEYVRDHYSGSGKQELLETICTQLAATQ